MKFDIPVLLKNKSRKVEFLLKSDNNKVYFHDDKYIYDIILLLLSAIGLSPGGNGYFTCIQNMKLVTNKFKSGGLHEKHVVATWNVGNRLSVCL